MGQGMKRKAALRRALRNGNRRQRKHLVTSAGMFCGCWYCTPGPKPRQKRRDAIKEQAA